MVSTDAQRRAALPPERTHAPLPAIRVYVVALRQLQARKVVVMADVLRQNWERDCATYLQWLVDEHCKGCMQKYRCETCALARGKALLDRYAALRNLLPPDGEHPPRRNKASTLSMRYREISRQLRNAGKPLRAREIVLRSTASRNIKWWTLRRMLAKGLIFKTRVKNIYGRYEVAYYTKKGKQQ